MANAAPTSTTWLGTTTDSSLGSNWTFGTPDATSIDAYIGASTTKSLINFGAIRARGTLTASTNFVENDEVAMGGKEYTYKDAPSADGDVDVGLDLETSLGNLYDAINLVAGGAYGGSMTIHPTITALSSSATVLVVAAKDGGAAGNSLATTVGANVGDGTWGAGTLENGAATAAIMNNVWTDGFIGNINSSGDLAVITFNKFFHGGSGTVYIDAQSGNRFIVNSPNYALAASLKMTGDIANAIEIVQGRVAINWNGLTGSVTRIWVDDFQGRSENLSLTGTGTVPELEVSRGVVTTNGPAITAYDLIGGSAVHQGGAIAAARVAGHFSLQTTDTMTKAYVQSGTLTTLDTVDGKTVTKVYVSPSAEFLRRDSIDTFTLYEIGVQ